MTPEAWRISGMAFDYANLMSDYDRDMDGVNTNDVGASRAALQQAIEAVCSERDRLKAENAALNHALFHHENGLSHPDPAVRKLIEAAVVARADWHGDNRDEATLKAANEKLYRQIAAEAGWTIR